MTTVRIALVCYALSACPIVLLAAETQNIANGDNYSVDAGSIDMVSPIPHEVFRDRLAVFWGRFFWEQGETLSIKKRRDIADQAIQDCAWLEICGEGHIVRMAVARLIAPDLVNDPSFRNAVIEQTPNPLHRTGAYIGEIAYHMTPSDKVAFYGKVNSWWEFAKEEI